MKKIVKCNMLGKLVELSTKNDSVNTIVEWISLKNDNFLYRHFKRKGHTPANILVQPVEKKLMMQIQPVDLKLSKDMKPN